MRCFTQFGDICKSETLSKTTLFHGCFLRFSNCVNGTKSRNAPYMIKMNMSKSCRHLYTIMFQQKVFISNMFSGIACYLVRDFNVLFLFLTNLISFLLHQVKTNTDLAITHDLQ